MNKGLKYSLAVIVIILLAIQLVPVERPETTLDNPNDIHKEVLIDADVSQILRNACYDCHSNETVYPWYANVAPVSWLVSHDVKEGREELNFSEWVPYSIKRKKHKLDEIAEEVEEGEMPMAIYTFTHSESRLSKEDKDVIVNWALNLMGTKE